LKGNNLLSNQQRLTSDEVTFLSQ